MTVSPPPASAQARAETLRGLCGGAVHLPGDPVTTRPHAVERPGRERPGSRGVPRQRGRGRRIVRAAAAAGLAGRHPGHRPRCPAARPACRGAVLVRTSAMTAGVGGRGAADGAGRRGALWLDAIKPPATPGWPCLTAPPRTWASSAPRSAAAWGGTPASSGCSAAPSPGRSWCPRTVRSPGSTRSRTPELPGRGAGAAAGSGSSRRWSSSLRRRQRLRRDAGVGLVAAGGSCARWGGAPRRRTPSPRRSGSSRCRRWRAPPRAARPPARHGRRRRAQADDVGAAAILAPLRALGPSSTRSTGSRPASSCTCSWTRRGPPRLRRQRDGRRVPRGGGGGPLGRAGPAPQSAAVELRQLGGAVGRPYPDGGVLDHLAGAFLVLGVGLDVGTGWRRPNAPGRAAGPGVARPLDLQARRTPTAYEPAARRGCPPRRRRTTGSFGIRRSVDPNGLFVAPQADLRRLGSASGSRSSSRVQVARQGRGSTVVESTTTRSPEEKHDHRSDQHCPRRHLVSRELDALLTKSATASRGACSTRATASTTSLVSPWNLAVPVRPAAVLAAHERPVDVVEGRAVRRPATGYPWVTPQATGHGADGRN